MKDLAVPKIDRIVDKLESIKHDMVSPARGWYNREDLIKISFIDGLLQGEDFNLLLTSYKLSMKNRFS